MLTNVEGFLFFIVKTKRINAPKYVVADSAVTPVHFQKPANQPLPIFNQTYNSK